MKTRLPQSMIRRPLFLGVEMPVFIVELVACSLAFLFLSQAPFVSLVVFATVVAAHIALAAFLRKDGRLLGVLSRSTKFPARACPSEELRTLREKREPTFPYREI